MPARISLGPALFLFAPLLATVAAEGDVDFARDIRPILSENCFFCHGPDEEHRDSGLRLDLKEEAFADRDGVVAFVPGDLEKSESWYRIITEEEDDLMPPPKSHKKLTASQKDLIRRWIAQGAEWTDHWSFVAAEKTGMPAGAHPVDHFIRLGLKRQDGRDLSSPADPRTLARRLHFDLTGLPPAPERVDAFVRAHREDARAATGALIDELLASPHFGERMAVMWLDAARYGDTSVMHADGPRTMWPWRDWVVEAYNANLPFDTFSIEQLAGDLFPDATPAQKIASGFNRNHATSDEGGAIPEELRVDYVVDRVQTTSNVWMGLTMECAQCHDHKYDPISQKEYYGFFAFFNNHTDPGMQTRKGNQAPVVEVRSPEREQKLADVAKRIEASAARLAAEREKARPRFVAWNAEATAAAAKGDASAAREPAALAQWFPLDEEKGPSLKNAATGAAVTLSRGKMETSDRDGKSKALKLNGGTEYSLGQPVQLPHDGPFSFAAWIRVENTASGAVFSCMDVSQGFRGYDLWIQGRSVGTHIINAWSGNAIKVVSTDQLKPKTWQHVVVSYDGSRKAAGVRIYIDGKLSKGKVEADSLTGSIETTAPFKIGSRSQGGNFKGGVDDIRIYRAALSAEEAVLAQNDPVGGILATPEAERSPEQTDLLFGHYLSTVDAAYPKTVAAHAKLTKERADLEAKPVTTMVMQDNPPEKMRMTYLLNRGAYDQPKEDEAISAVVPAILPPFPADAPANRLGLARWLFTEEHPLTARVAVNQVWQVFLGRGLVSTPGDFGAQGAFPSHPELLDWLAVDFRENGWDVKRLVRQILTSAVYQQSSVATPEQLAADPDNVSFARAARLRLQAEFLRDNALAVSGILNREMGGPGVKPYQPPGLWAEVSLGGNPKFVQDKGEKLYRRSLYTYWKRSSPPPNMLLFDAPTREKCVLQRPRTNTPLQALVTMNDVQYVEAARHLAERMMKEGGGAPEAAAGRGFELATARPPTAVELDALLNVFESSHQTYQAQPEAAAQLLANGSSPRDTSLDPASHAAWTVVASVILNLDETMTRE